MEVRVGRWHSGEQARTASAGEVMIGSTSTKEKYGKSSGRCAVWYLARINHAEIDGRKDDVYPMLQSSILASNLQ